MRKKKHELMAIGLIACVAGAGTEALAETSSKKKKKIDEKSVLATLEATPAQTSEPKVSVQPAQLPPGQRQLLQNSLESRLSSGVRLRGATRDELLREKTGATLSSGDARIAETINPVDAKKNASALNIGASRNRDIAQGYVAPPGVSDFVWYTRASAASSRGQLENSVFSARPGSMDADEFKKQTAAEELRKQTADSIRQILLARPSKDQRLELLFRLAEIQMERQAFAVELEIRKFNEEHDRWTRGGMKGAEPVFKQTFSHQQRLVAVDSLRSVARDYPSHPRTAEALFTLGFLLTQGKGESPAAMYFEKLVKDFPKSDLVPDAHLSLGEYHFAKMNFSQALKEYQKVLTFRDKNPNAYNYAVFKLGWTFFNLRSGGDAKEKENLGKSLAAFKLVVKRADQNPNDKILKDLRRDALRDMVLVFADLGDVKGAESYFEGLGERELYLTMLERLAWQYSENGEYPQSIAIYQKLIAEAPEHERLPQFYAQVPELYEKQGQTDSLLQYLNVMARAFAADSQWSKKFASNSEAIASKDKILQKEFRGWAERFHAEAQKTNREKRYTDAVAAYGVYLDNFGTRPESYSSHFYRSEILARKGQYLEAAEGYMRAVQLDTAQGGRGKFNLDAVVNAIACLDKVLEKSQTPNLPEAGKATERIPLTATHEKLVRAIDVFVALFPQDKQVMEFSHRAARIQFAFGDYPAARKRWLGLAEKFPKSAEVRDGLRLTLKVYLERKDWDSAIADCRVFLAIPGVKDSELGADVVRVLKASTFSKALVLEQKEQRAQAADLFVAYQREFQTDAEAPKALFNAANNRFKLGKIDEAISVLRILMAQYPSSPLVPNALYMIASANDSLGRFSDSSAGYEKFARDNPKDPVSPDVLLRAAEQRLGMGDYSAAQKDVEQYRLLFPGHAGEVKALYIDGQVNLVANKNIDAVKLFSMAADKSVAKDPKVAVHMYGLAADAAFRVNDKHRSQLNASAGLAIWARLPEKNRTGVALEGVRLLALVQFGLLDEKVSAIFSKQISDGEKIVEEFGKIRAEAQVFEQKYADIVKVGNAEAGVAALYRIAEIREFLANILLKAPVPQGSSAAEIDEFRSQVEKIALPMAEEATKLYAAAWQKSNESEAITPFQQKLHAKLAVLMPNEFRAVNSELPRPAYYSSDIAILPETKDLAKD